MKKPIVGIAAAVAVVLVLSLGCMTVFAAESDVFSYWTGRQNSTARNDLYAQAQQLPEEEQDAFLAENGIGDTPYSEEAAASYGYVTGQAVGSQYEDDTQDKTGYSYTTGQAEGASHTPDAQSAPAAAAADAVAENAGEDSAAEGWAQVESGYSFQTGRQNSTWRNGLYAQAEQLPEEEQDAFLAENGVGETPYSEDAAASYSYVGGQQWGASYRHGPDTERTQDITGYSFVGGQQRGASYQQ